MLRPMNGHNNRCAKQKRTRRRRRSYRRRRGVVTLWTILSAIALLALLCVVVEAANLWLARTQLQNALEAAALAAVKTWGGTGGGPPTPTLSARNVGVDYASYNAINEVSVAIGNNYAASPPSPLDNENASCSHGDGQGILIFGKVEASGNQWIFNANQDAVDVFGVRAAATIEVPSLCAGYCGLSLPFYVSATATTMYNSNAPQPEPRLIRVLDTNFTCGP